VGHSRDGRRFFIFLDAAIACFHELMK